MNTTNVLEQNIFSFKMPLALANLNKVKLKFEQI